MKLKEKNDNLHKSDRKTPQQPPNHFFPERFSTARRAGTRRSVRHLYVMYFLTTTFSLPATSNADELFSST